MSTRSRPVVTVMLATLIAAALSATPVTAQAGDWPCFRGPGRSGIASDTGLPLEWSDSKNILWKTALPGAGASSPVTIGDRIYVTCYSGYGLSRESPGRYEDLRRHVVCLAREDGRILWDAAFPNVVPDDHYVNFINLHGYASSTPAVDETGVYTFFGTTGVRAYSHGGALRWECSVGNKYMNFGSAASPVLFGNLVIINASVESEALIALDKASGREAWRIPLSGQSRSTPLVLGERGAPELVFHLKSVDEGGTRQGIIAAVDPRDGRRLWECQALDNYLIPSPIAHNGVIYALGGHPNAAVAIRSGGRGVVTDTHTVWTIRHGSEVCTPIFHEGHLYWTNEESGIAYCCDARSGALVYQQRLQPRPGRIYASGVIADGKLYYVSRENGTFVLAPERRFKLLAHNVIESDDSVFNATPAISRGQLLLRSDRNLYCIGTRD